MIRYLGIGQIAGWFGVDSRTVTKWRERYPDFPEPDALTGSDDKPTAGWLAERETEIRQWHERRPGQGAGGGRPRREP